ncbi:alpha/beta hydrolase [Chitinophaga sp. SYP-B3965]|uniref:alpha/beta hydrolase n=1 Tax=Chitinophaga sp. SYP-B3965 TaxID=2663120 RepID=UPI001299B24B|nr:alpha/beta hydrolase-fold protein [Chitinophaga sp. SYP-B3965]MRG43860.1 alpha/beta hydrolase [Chitinophaga sp. SYP-B3965]
MRYSLSILTFCILSLTAFGQKQFTIGNVEELRSVTLNETRTLNIYLPDGYAADSAYPVIYLLDGSAGEDFVHISGVVQFLTMTGKMPASIVVGIANVDRKRDFTFPTTVEKDKKDFPTTGGSARFITFLEKELQPFIEKKYKTKPEKTVIGQSLGGLLATEVLLKKPALFSHYIIVSPSLWWDNESLLLQAKKISGEKVFIAVGTEGKQMEEDAKKLAELLGQVTFVPMPEEDHLTILHNAVYKALNR